MLVNNTKNGQTITIGKVRLEFARNLFEVSELSGKYEATVLVPKTDENTIKELMEAIQDAEDKAINTKWGGKMPAKVSNPVHDGNGVRENGEAYGDECKDCYVLTARSKNAPVVVDETGATAAETDVYSGCYGKLCLTTYGYDFKGSKGIGFSLEGFQKTEDGEPLAGSKPSVKNMFGVETPASNMFGL